MVTRGNGFPRSLVPETRVVIVAWRVMSRRVGGGNLVSMATVVEPARLIATTPDIPNEILPHWTIALAGACRCWLRRSGSRPPARRPPCGAATDQRLAMTWSGSMTTPVSVW